MTRSLPGTPSPSFARLYARSGLLERLAVLLEQRQELAAVPDRDVQPGPQPKKISAVPSL